MIANALAGPLWICVLALIAVLGDAFLPFLPSGSLVILAVLHISGMRGAPLLLAVGVAIASFLGDLLLLRLARYRAPVVRRRLAGRPKLAASVERMQHSFAGRTTRTAAAIAIIARFVPGGRTVLDLAVGHSQNSTRGYLRWCALGAVLWAGYIVSLGWLDSRWFDTSWLGFAVSCCAATAVTSLVVQLIRRRKSLAVLDLR